MNPTKIEWTDYTWNPVTGCTKVSAGCRWCWADDLSDRLGFTAHPWTKRFEHLNVVLHPERLRQPLTKRKGGRVFTPSMGDFGHPRVSDDFLDQGVAVMALTPRFTYQTLTKRPERLRDYLADPATPARVEARLADFLPHPGAVRPTPFVWPLPNLWVGTSIEDNRVVDRADALRETPAVVRFLSVEPMIGPVDRLDLTGIDWVICGGESGLHHRRFDPAWARELCDRCVAAGIPFLFKQVGGRTAKAGGRLLDGRTWDEFPPMARLA